MEKVRDEHAMLAALIRPIFNQPTREEVRDHRFEAVVALGSKLRRR